MRTWMSVVSLCLVALAGCAEEVPEDAPPLESPEPAPLPTSVGSFENATQNGPEHAFLLPVPSGGGLAGFQIDVPESRAHPQFEGSSFERHNLILEWQFDAAPTDAVVALYAGGTLLTSRVWTQTDSTTYLTAALPSETGGPPTFDRLSISLSTEVVPSKLGIVIGALGTTGPVALAVYFADAPNASFDDLVDPLIDGATVASPVGTGGSFEYHEYTEVAVGLVAPIGVAGAVYSAGEPSIVEELPTFVFPHGGARDVRVEAECNLGGWSYAQHALLFGEGAGTYEHSVGVGDFTASGDGISAWARGYGLLAGILVLGLPIGVAQADGAAHSHLAAEYASSNELEILSASTLCMDAALSTLLGVGAAGSAAIVDGIISVEAMMDGNVRHIGPSP